MSTHQTTPREVRIVHSWGHGHWVNIADEALLLEAVRSLNARHGAGTHYLEYR